MITGAVTPDREAVIRLNVRGPTGRRRTLDAVIDTGYDGWLSLPPDVVSRLQLPWRRRGLALLADGTESVFDIHQGVVVWDKRQRRIPIDAVGLVPLVGMAMMNDYELQVQVRSGGRVTLTAIGG